MASLVTIDTAQLPRVPGLTPIPQRVEFKEAFLERYRLLLGEDFERFLAYARKSIRVNTLKNTVETLRSRLAPNWTLEPVPWCPEGFFATYRHEERYDIGNLIEHQLGYLYVQDAASMIPPIALAPKPGELVLDLCAAPGSKTTQLAAMMRNKGVIVANDVSGDRLKPLGLNLQRCGVANTIVTIRANARLGCVFDRVLVDAPCSATGTVRRSLKTLQMWSPAGVRAVAREQRRILMQGWATLKPGGTLVYSTCTLEPEENEGNLSWFLGQHPEARLEPIELQIVRRPAIASWDGEQYDPQVRHCVRIAPQDNDTEGFFVAKLRKLVKAVAQASESA
jgi:NOL1/NOP2/sun family putative RNA methylase